ncbi:hypothetical protein [Parerythrobacter lacustris]|uniref:Uncharacterized protein n=1 Tax=Parerythrobacter lacustris TaxID=2969984 RepID=A0ABT1XQJ0_9SPHN|nr:hypothetical protein [Parerythrobacter lacustris]MCR2833918.1 hypothetical protein [Parerythrobacter lacustris]
MNGGRQAVWKALMRTTTMILLAVALASCAVEPKSEPVDIEQMNKDALGPPVPITLEPITFARIEGDGLFGAGCNFSETQGGDLLLIAQGEYAAFLLDGEVVKASPDMGSDELSYAARAKYDGMANSIRLELDETSGAQSGMETVSYPGALTITDDRDRPVYSAKGYFDCGA